MRSLVRLFFLLVVLLGIALDGLSPVWGQDQDKDRIDELNRLFQEIRQAEKQARYQAEQTVYDFSRDRVVTARFLVHYAYPYRRRETVGVPEGARCIMLEDGSHLWSYFPARRAVFKEPLGKGENPIPTDLPDAVRLLSRNYRIYLRGKVSPQADVYQVLEFLPHAQDRPRREVWLEDSRKVPVRVYVSRPDGRPAYRSEFDRVYWDPEFGPETFALRVPQDTRVYEIEKRENLSLEKVRHLVNRQMRLPTFIPLGYVPYNIILRTEAAKKRLQIVYTDGLSSFSVFFEWPASPVLSPEESLRAGNKMDGGPDQAPSPTETLRTPTTYRRGFMNVVSWDKDGQKTVCVGDVQEDQLREIGASLRSEPLPPDSSSAEANESAPPLDR